MSRHMHYVWECSVCKNYTMGDYDDGVWVCDDCGFPLEDRGHDAYIDEETGIIWNEHPDSFEPKGGDK